MELADALTDIGKENGLSAVGFAEAKDFETSRENLRSRKKKGYSGGMNFTYRNPRRSTSPSMIVADARTLIVGALAYGESPDSENHTGEDDSPACRVALYAVKDYYADLRLGLGEIEKYLKFLGYRARVVCDDNALMDREAGYRSGIGWYGKNTNLLMPERGSFFILGSVVTDAAIQPLLPKADGCGTCNVCVSSCPTGAILEGKTIDSRKCLAWLLQKTGVFPAEYRAALHNRIYGCDDCQTVCPINKKFQNSLRALGGDTEETGRKVLVFEILEGSDRKLEEKYGRWYIPNNDVRYLRRNALIVLGNIGSPFDCKTEEILKRYLNNADSLLLAHAIWAAKRLQRYDLLEGISGGSSYIVNEELRRPVAPAFSKT